MLDSDAEPYGGLFLENGYVRNLQTTWNSGSVLVAEGAGMEADRSVPVDVGAIARSVTLGKSLEEQKASGT